jgi:putative SOS response-associated peptidase YedK
MCGRYILRYLAEAEREFELSSFKGWQESFNIAPTQQVAVVRMEGGARAGITLRWGLIPFFARGEPPKYSTINATIEKLESGATWRGPWKRAQRCILPTAGFYEWHMSEAGTKHPYFIHLADQEVFGFAAIWDRSVSAEGVAVESCAIITMPANDLMKQVHNTGKNPHRMPAILGRSDYEAWLTGSVEDAKGVLKQYPQDVMVAYRVSTRVNTPKNNDASLLEAVPESA